MDRTRAFQLQTTRRSPLCQLGIESSQGLGFNSFLRKRNTHNFTPFEFEAFESKNVDAEIFFNFFSGAEKTFFYDQGCGSRNGEASAKDEGKERENEWRTVAAWKHIMQSCLHDQPFKAKKKSSVLARYFPSLKSIWISHFWRLYSTYSNITKWGSLTLSGHTGFFVYLTI